MNVRFFIVYIVSCLVLITRLAAQPKLTVDSLIAQAIENDYSVKLMEEQLERSVLDNKWNKAARLPVVSTNLWNESTNGRFYDPLSNQYTTLRTFVGSVGVSANWDVFNGGYANIKTNVDRVGTEIRQLTLRQRKKEVARAVAGLYIDILHSTTVQCILEKEISLYASELQRLNELLLQKKITFADFSSVTVGKQRIEDKKYVLAYEMDLNFYQLGLLTGNTLTIQAIALSDTTRAVTYLDASSSLRMDSATLRQVSVHYEIKQLETKKAALTSDLRASDGRLKIKVGAGVYSGYSTNRLVYNSETNTTQQAPLLRQLNDNTYEAVTVNFYLPLYDRRNRIVQRQTSVDERIAGLERDDMERKIFFKYEMARKELAIKQKRLDAAQHQFENEQQIFNSFRERSAAERLSKQDLFLARQRLLEAEVSYRNSYFDFFKTLRLFKIDYEDKAF